MKGLILLGVWGALQSPGGLDPKAMVGSWQGEARVVEGDQDHAPGPIPMTFTVDDSLRGEGTVGEAKIRDWRLQSQGRLIRIEARLEGRVRVDAPSEKDHLTLLVREVGPNQFTAEVQLRCDQAFDPTPAEGRVTFNRVRPLTARGKPASSTTAPIRP